MIDWIMANWSQISIVIACIITIASVVVKLTPNETDNKVLEKIIKIAEAIGLNTDPVNQDKV